MMNYQLIIRNPRSKGLTVKQALQYVLFFAVGIWVIYQLKNSRSNPQQTTRSRLKLEELHSNILGRKGTGRWSENFGYSEFYLKDVNLMAANEKKEDKEFLVYEDSNIAIQVGEEDEVASKNGMLKEDFIEKEMGSSEGVEGNIKDLRMNNVTSKGEEMEKGKSDFLLKRSGLDNTTTTSVKDNDEKDGSSNSFHDENGVPRDPDDESTQDESTELGNESRMVESLPVEGFKRSGILKSDSDSDM